MSNAYHQPTRLDEALKLVAKGATPVAGATGLYSLRSLPEGELVDVTRLGLSGISLESGRVWIGAATTLTQIGDAKQLPGCEGALLRRAAKAVGSRPMRNMITLGGNLAHSAYWEDMPPVLLAVEAMVEVQRAGEPAQLFSMADCLKPGKRPWDGGLITRFAIPLPEGIRSFGYERFSKTVNDYSLCTSVCVLRREGQAVRDVRLVLGAVQPRPYRVPEAEKLVEGKAFAPLLLDELAAKVREVAQVGPNFRASNEYRRELTGTLSRRAVETAFNWAMRET